nr:uncharacterized protein LOC111428450 [Onthophagus taurus]
MAQINLFITTLFITTSLAFTTTEKTDIIPSIGACNFFESFPSVSDSVFEVVSTNITYPHTNVIKTIVYAGLQWDTPSDRISYISEFLNSVYPTQKWSIIENYNKGMIYSTKYLNFKVSHNHHGRINYYIFTSD